MVEAVNQTNLQYLAAGSSDELGTGIFAVPDPTSAGFGAATIARALNITYAECVARGESTLGFRWVPHRINRNVGSCAVEGRPCVSDCGDDAFCICVKGRCVGLK